MNYYHVSGKLLFEEDVLRINESNLYNPDLLDEKFEKVFGNKTTFNFSANGIFLPNNEQQKKHVVLEFKEIASVKEKLQTVLLNLSQMLTSVNFDNKNLSINICFDKEPKFNNEDLKHLVDLNNFVTKNFTLKDTDNKVEIKFPINYHLKYFNKNSMDLSKSWTLSEVVVSNRKLQFVIDTIKNQNLSPYERYLAAYSFVTKFIYNEESKDQGESLSRSVVSVLTSDKIVCLGYANLLKTICESLDIPCYVQYVTNNKTKQFHAVNIVKILDKKYDINGLYEADPTFDSSTQHDLRVESKLYTHHLLPYGLYGNRYKLSPEGELPEGEIHRVSEIVKDMAHNSDLTNNEDAIKYISNVIDSNFVDYETLSQQGIIDGKLINVFDIYRMQDKRFILLSKGISEQDTEYLKQSMREEATDLINKSKERNTMVVTKFYNALHNTKHITSEQFMPALETVLTKMPWELVLSSSQNSDLLAANATKNLSQISSIVNIINYRTNVEYDNIFNKKQSRLHQSIEQFEIEKQM